MLEKMYNQYQIRNKRQKKKRKRKWKNVEQT